MPTNVPTPTINPWVANNTMVLHFLPPYVAEILLFLIVMGVGLFLARAIARRKQFQQTFDDAPIPLLSTQQRVRAQIVNLKRDPAQNLWIVQAKIGRRILLFCAADYASHHEAYQKLLADKTKTDFALFGLATLEEGGVNNIKGQIRDFDKVNPPPDFVTLIAEGQYPNDYFAIANLMDARDELWDDTPLRVYRAQVVRSDDFTLVIDLGLQPENAAPLNPPLFAHGSVRLFGYLA